MDTRVKTVITVQTIVNAPIEIVWKNWSDPRDIVQWCSGSPDWHSPRAENDPRKGGKFMTRMEAKDGSAGFDFAGIYNDVVRNKYIEYTIGDGRKVKIDFISNEKLTKIEETFEAETENSIEMQRGGWQYILDNFKKYTESNL